MRPKQIGGHKANTPTNKKTTPKILQIVFAICDSLLCQKLKGEGELAPESEPGSAFATLRGGLFVRRMYTRESGLVAKFFAATSDSFDEPRSQAQSASLLVGGKCYTVAKLDSK